MNTLEIQKLHETIYNKTNRKALVLKDLSQIEEINLRINHAVSLVIKYMAKEYSCPQKQLRVNLIKHMNVENIITTILYSVVLLNKVTLSTLVSQTASTLSHEELPDRLSIALDLIVVISQSDLYSLQVFNTSTIWVVTHCLLGNIASTDISKLMYLPPMLCTPCVLKTNTDSAHLTIKQESALLGVSTNHHNDNICLDHLNTMNKIKLSLDTNVLSYLSEDFELKTFLAEKKQDYIERGLHRFKIEDKLNSIEEQFLNITKLSYKVYTSIVTNNNTCHLTWKYDTRGRSYSQGYHMNIQGPSFKKAIVSLHKKELIPL